MRVPVVDSSQEDDGPWSLRHSRIKSGAGHGVEHHDAVRL